MSRAADRHRSHTSKRAPARSAEQPKRVTRPLTDEQRTAIALRWLEPLKSGEGELSRAQLRDEFSKKLERSLDDKTIKAAIRYAFERRMVELTVGTVLPEHWRSKDLERKLIKRWPIEAAIVVDTHESVTNSDVIHHQLGLTLADSIADNRATYFAPNDIVGIGSGRAIHHLISSFDPELKFNVPNVTLMSLTGSIYPEAPVANSRELVDADVNTVLFANCFAQRTNVRTIAFPLAHTDVAAVRRTTWLHDPDRMSGPLTDGQRREFSSNDFAEHVPTRAFVGVGILDHNHRLHHQHRSSAPSTMLTPIRDRLTRLIHICEPITERARSFALGYYPCADVCNRLFFVEPPNNVVVYEKERTELMACINHINDHVLTVTKTQLSKVRELVLIAGTPQKALAVRRLLENPFTVKLNFGLLCTDAKTARYLLE